MKEQAVRLIFNKLFPKAKNTKIGQLADKLVNGNNLVSGAANGLVHSTPLTAIKSIVVDFLDEDGDGKLTVRDFKNMTWKTVGKVLGVIAGTYLIHLLYEQLMV